MIEPHPSDAPEPAIRDLVARASAFTSDSRNCAPGEIFVALRGERADGHDFVKSLVEAGSLAVVTRGAVSRLGLEDAARFGTVVEVADTHRSHRAIAGLFRRRFTGPLVGIGGSSGKTTAKEFLASMLGSRHATARTERSQNGELGIPKTLEKLRHGVEIAVVEIGIDAPGEMERHASLVAPSVAVLTSIGEEHLSHLESIERVYGEETILFETTIRGGGRCFAPSGDPWLSRLAGTPGVNFVPSEPHEIDRLLETPLRNAYARRNAALACAVALHLGMTPAQIAPVLAALEPPAGRGGDKRLPGGTLVLADHYNANPSSMRAALEAARARADEESAPLRLVVADMLDLGERTRSAHEALLPDLRGAGAEILWLVGPEMSRLASRLEKAGRTVRCWEGSAEAAACAADLAVGPAVVLLKGSRGMALESVLKALEGS